MVKVIVGVVIGLGLAVSYLAFGPKGTESKARAAGQVAIEKAESARFDYCQKEFLEETSCFQKLPSAQCVSLIQQKCGSTQDCVDGKCPAPSK